MKNIKELKKGEKVTLHGLLTDLNLGETAQKKEPFARFGLVNASGYLPCVNWNVPVSFLEALKGFESEDVLEIVILVDEYNGSPQGIVQSGSVLKGQAINFLTEVVPVEKENVLSYSQVEKLIKDGVLIKNETVRLIALTAIQKYQKGFEEVSAAKKMHHAKAKGLIRHTFEMLQLATSIAKIYPNVDMDIVNAGIILHDLWKTEEYLYSYGIALDFSTDGVLMGHLLMGSIGIKEIADSLNINDPDKDEIVKELIHVVASHHGKQEWGAIVVPATIEAIIVHHIDGLDADLYKFSEAEKELEPGTSMDVRKGDIRNVYKSYRKK